MYILNYTHPDSKSAKCSDSLFQVKVNEATPSLNKTKINR